MHWKHSRYQVVYQILGNCHTIDEAYRILCELEEDREFSINISKAESERSQAKIIGNKAILDTEKHSAINNSLMFETEGNKHLANAFIQETIARTPIAQACLDECRRELSFIRDLKRLINPYRKYKDYLEHEAHQLCQAEEYYYDLLWKAYNYMCAMQGLTADHWMLIKMHPSSGTLVDRVGWLSEKLRHNPLEFYALTKSQVFSKDISKNLLIISNLKVSETGTLSYEHNVSRITDGSC
jgi:hypothetical protein